MIKEVTMVECDRCGIQKPMRYAPFTNDPMIPDGWTREIYEYREIHLCTQCSLKYEVLSKFIRRRKE